MTRYEEAFLPEGKKRPRSLRFLGLASLLSYHHQSLAVHTIKYTTVVDNRNNDVVIYWTMTGIHVVPDRLQYIGLRQVHTLYRIDNSIRGTG